MSKILALIFYNGRVFTGSEGVMFEGNNIAIYLKRDCSLEELKARVRKKLKLRRNQVISNVLVRLWRSDNPLTYHGYNITDDEDMEMIMERFNEDSHLKVIELYVDITEAGSSSTPGPSQTSSHHTLTMGPETHTGGGAALDNVDQPYQGGTFDNTYETNVYQPYQGGTLDNTYERNVDQTYQGGTFDNTYETNIGQTVSRAMMMSPTWMSTPLRSLMMRTDERLEISLMMDHQMMMQGIVSFNVAQYPQIHLHRLTLLQK